jgi:alpha/beta hydrolase family protein
MTHRTRTLGLAVSIALVAGMVLWTASASALPSVSEIPFSSGKLGHPYDSVPTNRSIPRAPFIDLAAHGYVEREFRMSGGATTYRQRGFWTSSGNWPVSTAQTNVPYTTRLLVRYPTNPAKFNGTVIFEWLNDTTGGDQDPVWSNIYEQALADGFAYVGVTAQKPGMDDLRTLDPQRYGSLGDLGDGQSYDIFTQAAQVVKANSSTLLGGLTPKKLVGSGDSQSAFRVVTYVNAIQPVTHAFDGFLAVGRSGAAAPIGSGLISAVPYPVRIRTDNTARFIQLNTEGDIAELGAGASRQPDNSALRTWELPGASHIDSHEAAYEVATIARDQPSVPIPHCALGTPITGTGTPLDGVNETNNMPLYELEHSALAALQKWLANAIQPPHSPQISTIPLFFGAFHLVNHDSLGNALGGIRLPEIVAPTETYSAINFATTDPRDLAPDRLFRLIQDTFTALQTGGITNTTLRAQGLCLLSGYYLKLPKSTLSRLYSSHADYVAKYTAAANAAKAAGFLTPADAADGIARAQAAAIP